MLILHIICHCVDQDRSDVTVTPRSLKECTGSSSSPFDIVYIMHSETKGSSYIKLFLLLLWIMSSNLSSWSFMLLCLDHSITLSRSCCSNWTSCSHDICFDILVSSAKKLTLECMTHPWRSFMNKMKRIGPSTVPWGTPLNIQEMTECWPLRTTDWVRFTRNDSIQSMICWLKPYLCSFKSRRRWSTLSNALA